MWQGLWSHHPVVAYVALAATVVAPAVWVLFFTPRSLTLLAILVLVLSAGVGVAASKVPAKHQPLSKSLAAATVVASLAFAWAQVARPDDAPTVEGAAAGDSAGGIASLKNAQDLIKPIVRDITTAIEPPSDRDDRARANDWIDSYRQFYARFVDVNRKLQDFADATNFERVFKASEMKSAMKAFGDAATATKSKGDALGIVCPWVSSTG